MITLPTPLPLLDHAIATGASDIHLHATRPAYCRHNGDVARTEPVFPSAPALDALTTLLAAAGRAVPAVDHLDFGFNYNGRRLRGSLYRSLGHLAGVLRVIPAQCLTLEQIGVPPAFTKALDQLSGLFLVSGATGDGKSTTLAAALAYLLQRLPGKVITLEDPVEYVHATATAIIDQLEFGTDFSTFSTALAGALRHDPDVILVGELRDFSTFETACHAATTGHLVLASVHGESAQKTIGRIVDSFPEQVRSEQRGRFAQCLTAIYTQQLVPAGSGRLAAGEFLITTDAIRNLIRDNRLDAIPGEIRTGSKYGMRSMDMHLAQLVRQHAVTDAAARSRCHYPENFSQLLTYIR